MDVTKKLKWATLNMEAKARRSLSQWYGNPKEEKIPKLDPRQVVLYNWGFVSYPVVI